MASTHKKIAMSVVASAEIEKLKKKKREFNAKINKKIKKIEGKIK